MCAINGVTALNRELVTKMNERTKHRGPDGSSVWEGKGITLGHNRLAIIDLNPRASQPMHDSEGRYTIVFNGEIYNYRELKEELKDLYTFTTESDTEVLLASYRVWGESMFPRLRGIFAFCIWDSKEETLILARDHMGVKPLHYSVVNGVLHFSSEECGLMEREGNVLREEGFAPYMVFGYVPSPDSLIRGVHKLPGGHLAVFKEGTLTVRAYYDPIQGRGVPVLEERGEDVKETLVKHIETGVTRQLVSDRPIGMFLSGGIDSSVVLHHMSAQSNSVRTYSVDFEMVPGAESEEEKFNADARLAEQTAQHYGATHKTFTLSIDDVRTHFISALESLDEPVANPTLISQYLLSKLVREDGVVVALGGDGGDELFGGYTRHRIMMGAYYYQKLPTPVRVMLSKLSLRFQKLNVPIPLEMHMQLMGNKIFKKKKLFTFEEDFYGETEARLKKYYEFVPESMHPMDAFMRIDRATWLPDESLARSDRSSMAHGLELRVPLLDLDVVTFSDTISPYKKTDPGKGKKILRDAYRTRLPEYLFNQPKRGWISPGAKWLRDPEILRMAEEILSSGYYDGLATIVDFDAFRSLLRDHVEKHGYYLYPLWNMIMLQVWARKYGVLVQK